MNSQLTCSQRQWLHSSVGRASHRYRKVTGSTPLKSWIFFTLPHAIAYIAFTTTIISSFPKLLFTPRNKLEILIKVPSSFPPTPPLTQQFAISEKLVPTFGYGRKFPKILNGSTNLAFVCVHTGTSSYAYRQFTWVPNITLIHEL